LATQLEDLKQDARSMSIIGRETTAFDPGNFSLADAGGNGPMGGGPGRAGNALHTAGHSPGSVAK
jgi:hypothetical protein